MGHCQIREPRTSPTLVDWFALSSLRPSAACLADVERMSRELPLIIHPALEAAVQLDRFPKSLLEVHILVLEQDGDVCGPAITGTMLTYQLATCIGNRLLRVCPTAFFSF